MTKQIIYDGTHRGYLVIVETYYGKLAYAFFWKNYDAEMWQPFLLEH